MKSCFIILLNTIPRQSTQVHILHICKFFGTISNLVIFVNILTDKDVGDLINGVIKEKC